MIGVNQAGRLIKKTTNRVAKKIENPGIPEIIQVILYADCQSPHFTAALASQLRGADDRETLQNIFRLVQEKIKYRRDRGREVVKSPGKLWADSVGDCKSYSIFIASILKNLGYRYKYRVVFYDPKMPNAGHIYPVVMLHGKEITLDAVPLPGSRSARKFNDEKPYWRKYDYSPACDNPGALSGVGELKASDSRQWLWAAAALIGFVLFANMWK